MKEEEENVVKRFYSKRLFLKHMLCVINILF